MEFTFDKLLIVEQADLTKYIKKGVFQNQILHMKFKAFINMKEEFIAYGLPSWIMYLVGSLKVAFSIGLLAGLWIPEVVVFSASGIAIMMFFAIIMHAKIKDPLTKSIPAITFLVLSVLIILLER